MNIGDFAGREGDEFRVAGESVEAVVTMTLTSVTVIGRGVEDGTRQLFSLLLHGPLEPRLADVTHRFDHDALGAFDMFISALGPDPAGMRYEAIFG